MQLKYKLLLVKDRQCRLTWTNKVDIEIEIQKLLLVITDNPFS